MLQNECKLVNSGPMKEKHFDEFFLKMQFCLILCNSCS